MRTRYVSLDGFEQFRYDNSLLRRKKFLVSRHLDKSHQHREAGRVKRKRIEAKKRLRPRDLDKICLSSDRLVACIKTCPELSDVLKRMHPLIEGSDTGGVMSIRCASCSNLLAQDIVTFHECPKEKWQIFTGCIDPLTKKCKLCGQQSGSNEHRCRVVSRVVIDLVGIGAISNPLTDELSRALATIMKLPGLRCSVFNKPSTEDGTQMSRSCWKDILMHHSIVARAGVPEKGYSEYTVTGLDPESIRSFKPSSPLSPCESRAIVGIYASLDRFRMGGMPDLKLSSVNSITIQGISVPPMTSHYYCNCAHGTSANVTVLDTPGRHTFMFAIKKSNPGDEMEWDYNAVTDDPDDPDLKIACTCGGNKIDKLILIATMHEYAFRACPKFIMTFEGK